MAAAACAAILGLASPGRPAPITFITALPVAQDQAVTRFYMDPHHVSDENEPFDENLWNLSFPATLAWGPTARLAIFVTGTPEYDFIHQNLSSGQRVYRSASGFGDTVGFARYTLYSKDWIGGTFREDPLIGLYLPTGWYNKSDIYGRLPEVMQNGSGSVAPYIGNVILWKNFDYEFDHDITFRSNPAASSGYQEGDAFRTDAALYVRVYPWVLPDTGLNDQLWVGVETNLAWNGKSEISGNIDNATGGWEWDIDPGIFLGTPFWTTGAALQLPAWQDLYGPSRLYGGWRLYLYFEYYWIMPSLPESVRRWLP
jgi:hypothetical protein